MKNETNDKDIVALEIMSEAENYTSYIYSLLLKNIYKENVLDFGSGYGDFCNFLNDKNFNVSGFEPNELAFKKSLNYGFEVFNNYEKIIKKYNTITSINVLEHIEDDNAALQQIKSLMNNDSKLILYLPASMKIWSQMDVDANHFRRYTKKDISEKLEYNGIPEWDSIGHMTLMSGLEEAFNISIETDDIIDFSSYNKGKEILKKYNVLISG